jgi:hypothetical protein
MREHYLSNYNTNHLALSNGLWFSYLKVQLGHGLFCFPKKKGTTVNKKKTVQSSCVGGF